jgi:hypothetical protein
MSDRAEEDETKMNDELKDQLPVIIDSWETFGVPLEVISDDGRGPPGPSFKEYGDPHGGQRG